MRLLKKLNIMSTMNLICCWMRLEMKWAVNTKAPMRNSDFLKITTHSLQVSCNPLQSSFFSENFVDCSNPQGGPRSVTTFQLVFNVVIP